MGFFRGKSNPSELPPAEPQDKERLLTIVRLMGNLDESTRRDLLTDQDITLRLMEQKNALWRLVFSRRGSWARLEHLVPEAGKEINSKPLTYHPILTANDMGGLPLESYARLWIFSVRNEYKIEVGAKGEESSLPDFVIHRPNDKWIREKLPYGGVTFISRVSPQIARLEDQELITCVDKGLQLMQQIADQTDPRRKQNTTESGRVIVPIPFPNAVAEARRLVKYWNSAEGVLYQGRMRTIAVEYPIFEAKLNELRELQEADNANPELAAQINDAEEFILNFKKGWLDVARGLGYAELTNELCAQLYRQAQAVPFQDQMARNAEFKLYWLDQANELDE